MAVESALRRELQWFVSLPEGDVCFELACGLCKSMSHVCYGVFPRIPTGSPLPSGLCNLGLPFG